MEFGHPHARAFWEPVRAALIAYILGGSFGLSLALLVSSDPTPAALLWASGCAILVWAIDHFAWLLIVAQTYRPAPAEWTPDPEPEPEPEPLDIGRYMVERLDKSGTWVINPGCTIEQLSRFAQAIVHEGATTTYHDIVVTRRIFQQAEYRSFLTWLISQRYAVPDGSKGEVKLTELGDDFVNSVFSRGIQLYSPAAPANIGRI